MAVISDTEMKETQVSGGERPAVDIRYLRVDYGDFNAVNDFTLQVSQGEVFGLVGPNGAGKTSTFRVLATLMEPTYGEVFLNGVDILEDLETARTLIGYMPDFAPVPGDLKVREFLDFHAAAYGISGSRQERNSRVEECLAQVNMTAKQNAWCKELSRGQMQSVVLAKTLLHRPKILILDEPASGLDPLARLNLKNTLRQLAAGGATVLVSSHILSELSVMCSSLCVMNQGRLLASGTTDQIREQLGRTERMLSITVLADHEKASSWLKSQEAVHDLALLEQQIVFGFTGSDDDQADLMEGLIREGLRVKAFEENQTSFEDILAKIAENNQ